MTGPSSPPPAPPPAAWTPPGAQPAYPSYQTGPTHHMMPMMNPPRTLGFWAQAVGFLLVFAGTLVIVITGGPPASAPTSGCSGSCLQGVQYGIGVAKILWTLGLAGIGAGAGFNLRFSHGQLPPGSSSDETRVYLHRRWGEFVMVVLSIVLLFALLLVYAQLAIP